MPAASNGPVTPIINRPPTQAEIDDLLGIDADLPAFEASFERDIDNTLRDNPLTEES